MQKMPSTFCAFSCPIEGAFQGNFSCSNYIVKEVQQLRWILDFLSHIYSWLTTIEEVITIVKHEMTVDQTPCVNKIINNTHRTAEYGDQIRSILLREIAFIMIPIPKQIAVNHRKTISKELVYRLMLPVNDKMTEIINSRNTAEIALEILSFCGNTASC